MSAFMEIIIIPVKIIQQNLFKKIQLNGLKVNIKSMWRAHGFTGGMFPVGMKNGKGSTYK